MSAATIWPSPWSRRSSSEPASTVSQIEDVVLGNTQQQGEQGFNVARFVSLMAGLPMSAGGTTVNRLCGSSLQAVNQAAHAIAAGAEDVQIVGGLEHMHHIPMDAGFDLNPKLFRRTSRGALLMGVTAEFLAQSQCISREDQDAFALRSHQLAGAAYWRGHFRREIVPIWGHDEAGNRILVDQDQCIRFDCTSDGLAALKPAFMPGLGTVTAGNSSPLNDGAAAMLIMSEEKARRSASSRWRESLATAIAGVEPAVMGTGPVPATQKRSQRAGLQTRRYRSHRAQRSLRRASTGVHPDAGARSNRKSTSAAARSPSAIHSAPAVPASPRRSLHGDGRSRRSARSGNDVHRPWSRNRYDLRACLKIVAVNLCRGARACASPSPMSDHSETLSSPIFRQHCRAHPNRYSIASSGKSKAAEHNKNLARR